MSDPQRARAEEAERGWARAYRGAERLAVQVASLEAELTRLRAGIQALADEAEAFHYSREAVPQRPNILAALRALLPPPSPDRSSNQ